MDLLVEKFCHLYLIKADNPIPFSTIKQKLDIFLLSQGWSFPFLGSLRCNHYLWQILMKYPHNYYGHFVQFRSIESCPIRLKLEHLGYVVLENVPVSSNHAITYDYVFVHKGLLNIPYVYYVIIGKENSKIKIQNGISKGYVIQLLEIETFDRLLKIALNRKIGESRIVKV